MELGDQANKLQDKMEQLRSAQEDILNGLFFLEKLKQALSQLSSQVMGARERVLHQDEGKRLKIDCFDALPHFNLMGEKIHKLHGALDSMRAQFESFRISLEVVQENLEATQSGAHLSCFWGN